MAYINHTDIEERVSADVFLRIFDRNGTGEPDKAFLARILADVDSEVDMRTRGAMRTRFDAAGGTVDEATRGYCVDVALYKAVRRFLGASIGDAYRKGYEDALAFFAAMVRDNGVRPVTAATGRASPRASVAQTTTPAGVPTNPFGQAADGSTRTGF